MTDLLAAHLRAWLGEWPGSPDHTGFTVVGAEVRNEPGWDGRKHAALGITDAEGRGVLSVPPEHAAAVADLVEATGGKPRLLGERLPALFGLADSVWYDGIFRWSDTPAPLPDGGTWEAADGEGLPDWLRPFGAENNRSPDPYRGKVL